MEIYWTTIKKIIKETPEVKTFILDCPQDFTWEAGAHTHFALEGFNIGEKPNRSLVRHMSISTLPNEEGIGITTRIKEECSEFKTILKNIELGQKVALFKTSTNVPLKREGKSLYLLSAGVGLATFRPLILDYLADNQNITKIHSLNVDSTQDYLFPTLFDLPEASELTYEFVDSRQAFYDAAKELAKDKDGIFYLVGSDEFLRENIKQLNQAGIANNQIILDKHAHQLADFLV